MADPFSLALAASFAAWIAERIKQDRQKRREFYESWGSYDPKNIHGNASFADVTMLERAGIFKDSGGIPMGYLNGRPAFWNQATSILTLGKSGAGKGSQALTPALLQCPKLSFVVPDIDGELFNTTAEQRSRFGPVLVMDAFGMFPNVLPKLPRAHYNSMGLHWLHPDHPMFTARCGKLAAGTVSKGHGRDEYWYSGSRHLTSDFITAVRKYGRDEHANLTRVAELIHGDPFHFARWMMGRIDDNYLRARFSRWANPKANEIRSLPEVLENTKTQLNFLLDPAIAKTLSHSTFNFSQCAEQVMTVYILAPHELLDVGVAKYLSVTTMCALMELIRFNPNRTVRTVVMLDEFFELPFEGIDHLLVSARKAKTTLWLCMQDLAELKHLYRDTFSTIINNCGCVQWMSASDLDGSDFVSRMLGEIEVKGMSKTLSWTAGSGVSDPPTWDELRKLSVTQNHSQHSRRLMLPQEVRVLPNHQQILFMDGVLAPILAERKSYLDVPRLARRAGKNPFYNTPVTISAEAMKIGARNNWKNLLD